jgi:pimeloyl-ACP methyl ester carboxylesterase
MEQRNTHTVRVNNHKVHYYEHGSSTAPTLLLLHGFRSSYEGLLKQGAEFSEYHVIIPDLPGYGLSDELLGKNTVPAYAECIAGFITALGLTNVTIIGHSFGSLIGLICAINHPEKVQRLVLISPIPDVSVTTKATSIYYQIGRVLPSPLRRKWLTSRTIHRPVRQYIMRTNDPQLREQIMLEGERELDVLKPGINIQNFLSLSSINPSDWAEQLKIPTLVIIGRDDRVASVSAIKHAYRRPHTTIQAVGHMGHYAPSEIPDRVASITKRWLASHKITNT